MKKTVFNFVDYKAFLLAYIRALPQARGFRATLADSIGCQRAFVSQVLQGEAHFNLEHGEKVARALELGKEETHFFLLLVQLARASTESLREYFREQMNAIQERRQKMSHRLAGQAEAISERAHLRYYSAWYYGAIRILTAIPAYQTRPEIARRLGLPLELVTSVLEFLVELGLVTREGDQFTITSKDIYLGNDSAQIGRHHANWRIRAIQSLEREKKDEFHYSTAVVISERDAEKIKHQLMEAIEANRKLVRESGSEELFCVCLDFFRP